MTAALPPEVEARQVAALELAGQGFLIAHAYGVRVDGRCSCGDPHDGTGDPKKAAESVGKHGGRGWLEHATSDPDTIRTRFLRGHPNYGAVPPAGSGLLIVDEDIPESLETLGELPATLIVATGPKDGGRGRHVYGRLPPGIAEDDVPYQWAGGEVRIRGNGQAIGPYSRHRSGLTYEPIDAAPVAVLPEPWVRALIGQGHRQATERTTARTDADPGWYVTEPGRHDFLKSRARNLRGVGLSGERLRDELRRLNAERCRPPKPEAEVDDLAGWTNDRIDDDPPGVFLDVSPERPAPSGSNLAERFTSAAGLMATLPPAVEWTWHGFLAFGAVAELVGAAKASGKTTLLAHLMGAILDGRRFLDQPTTAGPIVFLTEQPTTSLRAVLERAGLAARDNLHILLWRDTRSAAWAEVVAAAVAECRHVGARVLIVDTLPAFAGIRGDAENDAGAALAAIEPLQVAAADGLAVVVVRHERKGGGEVGESGRGSSAFTGAVDVVLRLARQANPARPTIRVLSGLSRFDETPPEVVIELTDGGYVLLGDVAAVAFDEAQRGVLDVVPDEPAEGMTEAAIVERVGGRKSTVGAALRGLVAAGQVNRSGEGKRGLPFVYTRPVDGSGFLSPVSPTGRNGGRNETRPGDEPPDLWAEAVRIFADDLDDPSATAAEWTQ